MKNLHASIRKSGKQKSGFTLIELSIVLVIIGLIVGGVLVGQDLIKAAEVRAQITQIEKLNTAVNTFKGKYGYLPGDIPDPYATQFGFLPRVAFSGDGDGLIKGLVSLAIYNCGFCTGGETLMFFVDLSTANLIENKFNTATASSQPVATGNNIALYLPKAKMSDSNYINVWSGGYNVNMSAGGDYNNNGINYFSLSLINGLGTIYNYSITATPGISVLQAANIDKKIDDGLPQSGNITALYINANNHCCSDFRPVWAGASADGIQSPPYTSATSGTSTTCFDNGNVASKAQQYSIGQNGGTGVNCALSFKTQF